MPSEDSAVIEQAFVILERRRAQAERLAEAKRTQPERLAEERSRAADERIKALAAEPWADFVRSAPVADAGGGELSGMLSMSTVDAKELFGTRLAFDLLGCCADEEEVAAKLNEFYFMVAKPEHMFLVCAAALKVIANHVVPVLLDSCERRAGDYDTRVRLADSARKAWSTRLNASSPDNREAE